MKRIWKYEINLSEREKTFTMPRGARIVHIDSQVPDVITFWAIVDVFVNMELEDREFGIMATGRDIPDEYSYYWGTVLDNKYVWHLFEVVS